ncbi:MAG: pyruvate, phosphate dikinase [Deltaproteobacteria bacterium]|nr:MAG: pyruvate, phosphate dikinase [Deltaproteobacteria bacterium]
MKWVYSFNAENTEGNREMKNLLGGKGANLAEMSSLGLSVPPGFTVTTEACLDFGNSGDTIKDEIKNQVIETLKKVETLTGKKFGDHTNPLLLSVRSGARVSMPGMMDTVLNLGLCDKTVAGLVQQTGDARFAWDSYRRFIQMYANVVMGLNVAVLESTLEDLKEARNVTEDTEFTAEDLQDLVAAYKRIILEDSGKSFPTDPMEQLWQAIGAVFQSWQNPRAKKYREIHHYPHDWGTAVNVQAMVFGNMGDDCSTGVCFTRDPSTGEKRFFGEFLVNAQGEDVVAGIRTPMPINDFSKNDSNRDFRTLEELMPNSYGELCDVYKILEQHYKDMQDIEFTVEKGKLYILQTRNGKRTSAAAVKIAVDMVDEGLKTKEEAILSINPEDINQLLHPRLDPNAVKTILAKGLPASPGAASGRIVFDSEEANLWKEKGEKVILVRRETSPEDITGMVASEGVLTARGGMTSHAAVVARGMGKPCVAGCTSLLISSTEKKVTIKGKELREGDAITIDGATGEIFDGILPTIEATISSEFSKYMEWADEIRTLGVRTNADNPADSAVALKFGAEGIGLCRTEHMFFAPERILAIREMIFAQTMKERERALDKLLPFQKEDFLGIFEVMNGKPVNIRLLDPPLHEFLPHTEGEKQELANSLELTLGDIEAREKDLFEFNPMLGHRGCRLGVSYPEIYNMQVKAIILAAIEAQDKGIVVIPEIMIPLVALKGELVLLRKNAEAVIQEIFEQTGKSVDYKIGTMIEIPRAAITAGEIAVEADFFSFGTNDLTQTTYGLSRDDSGKFLTHYQNAGIFKEDPFVTLDQEGVGFLVDYANKAGRAANPSLSVGICGEHGGEPKSIEFCHRVGLDYVSCSPYRVPIARLAAAQATLMNAH